MSVLLSILKQPPRLAMVVILFCFATFSAQAYDDSLYVAPNLQKILPADVARRNMEESGVGYRKLGDLLGNALKPASGSVTDVMVTTQCGHYQMATVTYSDGFARTLSLSNAPAVQKDMEQAKAAIPTLRIVDIGGCTAK